MNKVPVTVLKQTNANERKQTCSRTPFANANEHEPLISPHSRSLASRAYVYYITCALSPLSPIRWALTTTLPHRVYDPARPARVPQDSRSARAARSTTPGDQAGGDGTTLPN